MRLSAQVSPTISNHEIQDCSLESSGIRIVNHWNKAYEEDNCNTYAKDDQDVSRDLLVCAFFAHKALQAKDSTKILESKG